MRAGLMRTALAILALAGLGASGPKASAPSSAVWASGSMTASGKRKSEVAPLRIISPTCTGEYADFLSDLVPANAAFEKGPDSTYSYCLRTTATYEHVYYGRGGKLKRTYLRAESHGTGFAYKQKDGDFYLATNEHVAEYPDVTDEDHTVDGVPAGSRKVRETVKIVANESDDYEPGQVVLSKVVADAALDIAVFKTKHPLKMVPYRMGKSGALRAGNVILARGYPLGVFPASNSGKVTNPYQEDNDQRWQHVDFVTDALLNSGNSGSPVFAVSCKTGELELVGIYHAHYAGGTGLGLVIGIDQVRDVLENLKLPKKDAVAAQAASSEDRKRGLAALERGPVFFPYSDQVVRAEKDPEGAVRFILFRDFPLTEDIHLAIVDTDGRLTLEMPARVPRPVPFAALDPQLRDPLERLHEGLWRSLRMTLDFRAADAKSGSSPEATRQLTELKSRLGSRASDQKELLSTVNFEAEDASWPVIVDATERIENALPASALVEHELPDGGAAIP